MSHGEFGCRRSWANAVIATACLFVISCATPVDESAAKEETQSSELQSETWEFDCKSKILKGPPRHYPLDLVIKLPVCSAVGFAKVPLLVVGFAALVAMYIPVAIADLASETEAR